MSLVVVGASAKDFTDSSKINYKDAVDVVAAAKIIDGYTDGSFNPTATLTRGAAAKIICNMPYDVYSGEITSASQLKSAIGKGTVDMDVYFDNGDITFICVTAVEDAVKYSVAAPTIVAGSTSNTANYSVATSYTAPVGAGTVITITLTGASGAVAQNVAVAATGTGVTVSPASFSTVAGAGTYTVEVTVGSANVTAITLTMTTPA